MDEFTAIHPAQMLPPRTHVSVTPTSGLERAQVKWFNRLRGFGFLTCGEGTPGYLRAHGNAAPLRHDRTAPRPVCAGAVRARLQGHDGGRDSAGERIAGAVVALDFVFACFDAFSWREPVVHPRIKVRGHGSPESVISSSTT